MKPSAISTMSRRRSMCTSKSFRLCRVERPLLRGVPRVRRASRLMRRSIVVTARLKSRSGSSVEEHRADEMRAREGDRRREGDPAGVLGPRVQIVAHEIGHEGDHADGEVARPEPADVDGDEDDGEKGGVGGRAAGSTGMPATVMAAMPAAAAEKAGQRLAAPASCRGRRWSRGTRGSRRGRRRRSAGCGER